MTPNWLRLALRMPARRPAASRPTHRLALGTLEDRLAPAGLHGAHAVVGRLDTGAVTMRQAQAEIRFLEGMIDHHHMAVMTAELCADRAVHPELKEMCGDIATTQMAEIEQMQGWLKDWYGITYEPRMTHGMEKQVDKLAALTGAEFEVAFLGMMIKHHEGAVKEAGKIVDRAAHPELVAMGNSIIQAQMAEIAMMQGWLSDWYGIDPEGSSAPHGHSH